MDRATKKATYPRYHYYTEHRALWVALGSFRIYIVVKSDPCGSGGATGGYGGGGVNTPHFFENKVI